MTVSAPREGWVDPELAEEFPQLRLVEVTADHMGGRSTPGARRWLRRLSSRLGGPQAIALRQNPIPHAYRVFHRHVGLDPDVERTPIEAAAMDRLVHGGFRARGRLEDALLIALVETGVPVWALDDGALQGALGLRPARERERLGSGDLAPDLVRGRLVVADEHEAVAVLFGSVAGGREVTRATERLRLYSVAVDGVPAIHVEEALDLSLDALAD